MRRRGYSSEEYEYFDRCTPLRPPLRSESGLSGLRMPWSAKCRAPSRCGSAPRSRVVPALGAPPARVSLGAIRGSGLGIKRGPRRWRARHLRVALREARAARPARGAHRGRRALGTAAAGGLRRARPGNAGLTAPFAASLLKRLKDFPGGPLRSKRRASLSRQEGTTCCPYPSLTATQRRAARALHPIRKVPVKFHLRSLLQEAHGICLCSRAALGDAARAPHGHLTNFKTTYPSVIARAVPTQRVHMFPYPGGCRRYQYRRGGSWSSAPCARGP